MWQSTGTQHVLINGFFKIFKISGSDGTMMLLDAKDDKQVLQQEHES